MKWFFTSISAGLDISAAAEDPEHPQSVSKQVSNKALFDASGAPLTAGAAQEATLWRSHHAFGARCSHTGCDKAEASSTSADGNAHNAASYCQWAAAFHVLSKNADSHVLLSVAPRYFPYDGASSFLPPPPAPVHAGAAEGNGTTAAGVTDTNPNRPLDADAWVARVKASSCPLFLAAHSPEEQRVFDNRMLETPLIYEEPYALSVECTERGMFLWSDHWSLYGKRVATACLEPRSDPSYSPNTSEQGSAASFTHEAFVQLQWQLPTPTSSTVASDKAAEPAGTLTVLRGERVNGDATPVQRASIEPSASAELTWREVFTTQLKMEDTLAETAAFVPYVTLMEPGECVRLLN